MASSSVIGLAKRVFNRLISALYVDQSTAEAGTAETGILSPLRVSQAISALSPSGSSIGATVGSGKDYATVKAAIDDGATLLWIYGTVTDTAAITFPTYAEIRAAEGGATWQPQASMTLSSGRVLRLSGLALPYSTASTFASQLGTVKLEDCTVSASDGQLFLNNTAFEARRVTWLPRNASGQIVRVTNGSPILMRDCVLTGAGSSCQQAISFSQGRVVIDGLYIDGTWNGAGTYSISVTSPFSGVRVSNVEVVGFGVPRLILTGQEIHDIRHGGAAITLDVTTSIGEARNIIGLGAVTITGDAVIHGLYNTADMTIPAGCRIFGGRLAGDITYSGAGALIEGVEHLTGDCVVSAAVRFRGGSFDHSGSGSLTLSSGAPRLEGMNLSQANITNNDPSALITGSTDVSDDTDPTTRRFDNATLDALRPHIIAFWPGDELPEPSKAPVYGRSAGGSMQPLTAASVVGANGFDTTNSTAEGFAAPCPFYYWSKFSEFTLSFVLRPVDATPPAGRSLIQWASQRNSLGFAVNYEPTGQLNVFSNPIGGTPVIGASGFIGAFSDDTDTRVTFALRNNGGTGTIYGYVDGVEVLTWTGFGLGLMLEYLILASRSTGNLGFPASYRNVYVFDIGLTEAQENLLDTNSLKGAGIA